MISCISRSRRWQVARRRSVGFRWSRAERSSNRSGGTSSEPTWSSRPAHFAAELRANGFDVDHRQAPTLAAGLRAHCEQFAVHHVIAMEPMSWDGRLLLARLGVDTVANDQFLCHYDDFAAKADGRKSLKIEDFYRWQRKRLDVLMDDGAPVRDRWNHDSDNREPPPTDGRPWPAITAFALDAIDREVLGRLPESWGAARAGTWPVTRQQALQRLEEFIAWGLGPFGPHEDAGSLLRWSMKPVDPSLDAT